VLSRRHWFPEFLIAATGHQAADADLAGPVAIFRKPGGNVLELTRMVGLLGETGWPAFITDPAARDWRYEVGAGYLKYGVQAVLADIGRWGPFLDRIAEGKLAIANPLPGRWIGDNKLCLAAMSDPRFGQLFGADERAAIARLIPYSRKVGDGVEPADLAREPARWVVKGPYDTRGNSVYIGSEHDRGAWELIVRRAAGEGWLAQEMLRPAVREWQGRQVHQDLSVVLLNGRWAGYTSRLSANLRLNVAQGGDRQLVFGHQDAGWRGDAD
jgi:hypothetical protein